MIGPAHVSMSACDLCLCLCHLAGTKSVPSENRRAYLRCCFTFFISAVPAYFNNLSFKYSYSLKRTLNSLKLFTVNFFFNAIFYIRSMFNEEM